MAPPVKPLKLLDIGCGEGKDSVFLAKNGYIVTAFDIAEAGIEKAKRLADMNNVE
jgi:2-polyprenyl-3-methyl-5-hydroxy-6-metoxy-1,4-benzoquinol methylase